MLSYNKEDNHITQVLAIPRRGRIRYDFSAMFTYCLDNEKELEELTDQERELFLIKEGRD